MTQMTPMNISAAQQKNILWKLIILINKITMEYQALDRNINRLFFRLFNCDVKFKNLKVQKFYMCLYKFTNILDGQK